MVNTITEKRFECSRCNSVFPDELDALGCCATAYETFVFICGSCDIEHDFEDDADDCCPEEEDEA
jgi:hypothetical protein